MLDVLRRRQAGAAHHFTPNQFTTFYHVSQTRFSDELWKTTETSHKCER